ncbi:hypothetical protein CCACVL1_29020 [Corchorus capsularis]|uniref:Uncharacterized protein n=1 Tax=Corchorus capsularis TaxID=210143 RepID=A0A1R3G491_COCAP|nr:hypothetical protein CCACVL1_29020 [Corchorus capsularis]
MILPSLVNYVISPYYIHASDNQGQVYVSDILRDGNYGEWMSCNAMVIGWLKSAMDKEVRGTVRYAKTAREIWVVLEERFGKESSPRVYEIRRAITVLRQEKMTMLAYYTKLKGLWEEIQSISPLPKYVCKDDAFGTVKTQILSTKPTPSLGNAYHLVAEDEQQKQISASRKPMVEAKTFQMG